MSDEVKWKDEEVEFKDEEVEWYPSDVTEEEEPQTPFDSYGYRLKTPFQKGSKIIHPMKAKNPISVGSVGTVGRVKSI